MSDDSISRRATIDAFWSLDAEIRPSAIGAILNMLNGLPSAERKKGRWLPYNLCGDGYCVCSSCKNPTEAFAADVLYKYCPFCGADMRGEQNDSV